jgi:hypothetical protein
MALTIGLASLRSPIWSRSARVSDQKFDIALIAAFFQPHPQYGHTGIDICCLGVARARPFHDLPRKGLAGVPPIAVTRNLILNAFRFLEYAHLPDVSDKMLHTCQTLMVKKLHTCLMFIFFVKDLRTRCKRSCFSMSGRRAGSNAF